MNTMARPALLTVLMHIFLMLHDVQCLEHDNKASLHSDALDLPWQDELCCDSPVASYGGREKDTKLSESNLPPRRHCLFRSSANNNHPSENAAELLSPYEPSRALRSSGAGLLITPKIRTRTHGTCMDIRCTINQSWENFTCDLQSRGPLSSRGDAGLMVVSLHRFLTQDVEVSDPSQDNPVICEAQNSFICSFSISTKRSFITVVTVNLSDAVAPSVRLRIPAQPVRPSPPIHLSHIQTIEAELIVMWEDPSNFAGPLRYEVRQAFNSTHPDWQLSALREPRLSLDLMSLLNYTVQVRCAQLIEPPLWSEWSEPHHIYLDTVSYIPEKIVAQPGENVTVYCVFNNHSINASTAMWRLNFQEPLIHSHPVNQWVSQVTVQPSGSRMYDLLSCTQEWTIPYSQIYVQGAFIDISCETNGDIDAMDCRWTNTQWTKLLFRSKWSYLPCDEMEEKDRIGEEVGELGPACAPLRFKPKTWSCTVQPLRMNCYKLWLEVPSGLGPIGSKPIYLTPMDHVKPHPPTKVRAVSQSNRVLNVTWEPPVLPTQGFKCQIQYSLTSTLKAQPDWKLLKPVRTTMAEVVVPDMCSVYTIQVRCMHSTGIGYWSEWSHSVHSTPQNSRAPERGPDFWRIQQEQETGKQTKVTLQFEHFSVPLNSYCVDGFVVLRQTWNGSVTREQIRRVASYSFEWDQEPTTVTVEAFNSEGNSTNNVNMTLQKQPKYSSVRSFHVSVINSTCVSLSWSLWRNSSKPLFMVVQWVLQREQEVVSELRGRTWRRLPYTEQTVHLKGDFFGSEDFTFYLYPVFADGEAEPVYTLATRRDPIVYLMLSIVSFLSIALFVTAVFSQNQVKRFVWKDVPNPRMCSWAKGVDFKKADTFDHLLQAPEGLPVCPLLLPNEKISKIIIMDQTKTTARFPRVCPTPDHATDRVLSAEFGAEDLQFVESESPLCRLSLSVAMETERNESQLEVQDPNGAESSAQLSVTYATVLHSDPKQECIHLDDKEGGGSSSSDEGNFSANNSDISGSFPGGLWELDSCRDEDLDDPRRSCSYNSVEELSETSEREDEAEGGYGNDSFYLGMDYPAEDEQSEDDEEQQPRRAALKSCSLSRDVEVESDPLLGSEPLSLYLPQFRTASHKMQLTATHKPDDI